MVSTDFEELDRDGIRARVFELIPQFVNSCLNSGYDVIVPIEREGLALLLPTIKNRKASRPEIIPSSSLLEIDKGKLEGKKVLVIDATVYAGYSLRKTTELIENNFNVKPSIAALLVMEGFDGLSEITIPGYFLLSPNRYNWAREVVIEYLLEEVFVHQGDPPLWEFNLNNNEKALFLETLLDFGTSYSLPSYFKNNKTSKSWLRLTVDNISLLDRDWLPKNYDVEHFHKIRIQYSRTANIIWILPLLNLKIPSEDKKTISELLYDARYCFPEEFKDLVALSEKVPNTPELKFRWVSAIGSLLLLRDFIFCLRARNSSLSFKDVKLSAPVPNLYQYSCSSRVLDTFEKILQIMLEDSVDLGQLRFPQYIFQFQEMKQPEIAKNLLVDENSYYQSPESILAALYGEWMEDLDGHENEKAIINSGLSINELRRKSSNLSHVALSRSIDRFVDEGILKPRIGLEKDYYVKKYAPGGESIRQRLLLFGLANTTLKS